MPFLTSTRGAVDVSANKTIADKFGYASALGIAIQFATPATWVDLWPYGGLRTSPTTSFTPYMASSDAADTSIDIEWTYQDASGLEQTVTVATDASDGRTPVSLAVTGTELYRGENVGTTALAGNVAATTANNFTAGVPDNQDEVLADIPGIDGRSQVLARRVPANLQLELIKLEIRLARTSGAAGSAIAAFQTRKTGKSFITERPIEVTEASAAILDLSSITLDPGTDFRLRIRDVSDALTSISGTLIFYEVEV